MDRWADIENKPIINFMLIGPSSTFFLESVSTGKANQDAQFITKDISHVSDVQIRRGLNICGAVTNNMTMNKAAWNILHAKYPALFFMVVHVIACTYSSKTSLLQQRPSKDNQCQVIPKTTLFNISCNSPSTAKLSSPNFCIISRSRPIWLKSKQFRSCQLKLSQQ